jgi:hypothetical protein
MNDVPTTEECDWWPEDMEAQKREAKQVEREWQQYKHARAQRELGWKLDINHSRFERLWRKAHRAGARAMHEGEPCLVLCPCSHL